MSDSIRFYYKENDKIYYITERSDELQTGNVREMYKNNRFHYYEAFKGYETSREGLVKFHEDFKMWCEEINVVVDYAKYHSHSDAVKMTFQRFSTNILKNIEVEDISIFECYYMEKCNNGGWIKFDDQYKNKITPSYGYDQSSFYPWLLANSSFKFPIKKGKRYCIDYLDFDNLDYGIYNVKILCDHKDFKKFFVFSKTGYYTHYDLLLAHKYQEQYDVVIELQVDEDETPNCLLYEETDLIDSRIIFNNWYERLIRVKNVYPKNKLIKHLLSSLWGHIIKFNRIFTDNEEKFFDLDITRMSDPKKSKYKLLKIDCFKTGSSVDDYRTRYEYIEYKKAYSNNLARLKPFFTAYARNWMQNLVLDEGLLDCLIRTHTDNITLTKQHDFSHLPYHPIPEKKTTGNIRWENVNTYEII